VATRVGPLSRGWLRSALPLPDGPPSPLTVCLSPFLDSTLGRLGQIPSPPVPTEPQSGPPDLSARRSPPLTVPPPQRTPPAGRRGHVASAPKGRDPVLSVFAVSLSCESHTPKESLPASSLSHVFCHWDEKAPNKRTLPEDRNRGPKKRAGAWLLGEGDLHSRGDGK